MTVKYTLFKVMEDILMMHTEIVTSLWKTKAHNIIF
jgi:hypothetical protein